MVVFVVVYSLLGPTPAQAGLWQYSVPMAGTVEQRAYLWIPPTCHRVRGLMVGLQNMLEKPLFEDPAIRAACADVDLGILWIAPGDEIPVHPPLDILFRNGDAGAAALDQALTDLAKESGYTEVQYAPLLPVGHSAATPFVWSLAYKRPDRVFAMLPYKGWWPAHCPEHTPVLHVSSEWAEWGANWGETWHKDSASLLKMKAEPGERELGEFVDAGTGHFDYNPESAPVIGAFIREAVECRIPDKAPLDGPVALKPYSETQGVLVAPETLGTASFASYPMSAYKSDPKAAYWYINAKMAATVNSYMKARFDKKPQMIDFIVDGAPAPLVKNGFAEMGAKVMDDGATFKVSADYMTQSPSATLFAGQTLGHTAAPVRFRVGSGGIVQTGPDTFKVALSQGGIQRQGNPWEPWIIAYAPGDNEYRQADRPAHVWIATLNKGGAQQAITWPPIANVGVGKHSIKLSAAADSKLPVQYYVVSGPAEASADGTVTFLPIPPRSHFPVRVRVAAFQWGRASEPRVQSAGPVFQEFMIENR